MAARSADDERRDVAVDDGPLVRGDRLGHVVRADAQAVQPRPRALQTAVHGGRGGAQGVRRLGRRPLEHLAHEEDRALAGRQVLHGRDEREPQLAAGHARPSPGRRRRARPASARARAPRGRAPRERAGRRRVLPGPTASAGDDGSRGPSGTRWSRSGTARCASTHAVVVPVVRAPGPQHRLLHEVLGVVHRPEHLVAVRQELAPVRQRLTCEVLADRHRRRSSPAPDSCPAPTRVRPGWRRSCGTTRRASGPRSARAPTWRGAGGAAARSPPRPVGSRPGCSPPRRRARGT